MKYIVLEESENSILLEYGDCRAVKSNSRPLHLCITGFTDGLVRTPTQSEIESLVKLIFTETPNIRSKMFTDNVVHVWEDTAFTRELLNI